MNLFVSRLTRKNIEIIKIHETSHKYLYNLHTFVPRICGCFAVGFTSLQKERHIKALISRVVLVAVSPKVANVNQREQCSAKTSHSGSYRLRIPQQSLYFRHLSHVVWQVSFFSITWCYLFINIAPSKIDLIEESSQRGWLTRNAVSLEVNRDY